MTARALDSVTNAPCLHRLLRCHSMLTKLFKSINRAFAFRRPVCIHRVSTSVSTPSADVGGSCRSLCERTTCAQTFAPLPQVYKYVSKHSRVFGFRSDMHNNASDRITRISISRFKLGARTVPQVRHLRADTLGPFNNWKHFVEVSTTFTAPAKTCATIQVDLDNVSAHCTVLERSSTCNTFAGVARTLAAHTSI